MSHTFDELGLLPELLQAIAESGYEQPTPIQTMTIPLLLAGTDVIGQAQTGTGKTAAYALPMLQSLDMQSNAVQAFILTPTRELAAQVATAVQLYGKRLGVRVLPIYGGASYDRQLKRLERGIHVVIGTPGRVLDLIHRRALDLSTVRYAVLDEADEMLKMGFIDDVEEILKAIPAERQTALFSATFSDEVRVLAEKYMRDPQYVAAQREKLAIPLIEQRYYMLYEEDKLAALGRLLETEDIQSALIFTRTRAGSSELAAQLLERGYTVDALHGELNQPAREAVLRRFRSGQLPILVATDVVARGVDISQVTHVFNYDIPYDPEDYVHRIGRTGRAGRSGVAIMLVTPRERRRLQSIEDYTRQPIRRAQLPEISEVLARRDQRFTARLASLLEQGDLDAEAVLVERLLAEGYDAMQVATAAMRLARQDEVRRTIEEIKPVSDRAPRSGTPRQRDGAAAGRRERGSSGPMVRLLVDLGHRQGVRPGDIVGAIAGEAGIPGRSIGAIDIQQNRTFFDVKADDAERVLALRKKFLRGKPMRISRANNA